MPSATKWCWQCCLSATIGSTANHPGGRSFPDALLRSDSKGWLSVSLHYTGASIERASSINSPKQVRHTVCKEPLPRTCAAPQCKRLAV